MARKHSLDEVLKSLGKKNDCRVDSTKKVVYTLNGKSKKQKCLHDLGNKSWGKIDYLVNWCGYTHYFVAEF